MPEYPVVQPPQPNLAPSYEVIQQALAQQAQTAKETPPTPLGNAAKLVGTAAGAYAGHEFSEAEEKHLIDFKAHAEGEMQKDVAQFKAPLEGRTPLTQDDINQPYNAQGITDQTLIPKAPKETMYMTAEEKQNYGAKLLRSYNVNSTARTLESQPNPNAKLRASLFRIVSADPSQDATASRIAGMGAVKLQKMSDGKTYPIDPANPFSAIGPAIDDSVVAKTNSVDNPLQLAPKDKETANKRIQDTVGKGTEAAKAVAKINGMNALENELSKVDKDGNPDVNPTAIANIRSRLALDVGGMSSKNLGSTVMQQEGFSKAAGDRFEQMWETWKKGDFTKTNVDYLLDQTRQSRMQFQNDLDGYSLAARKSLMTDIPLTDAGAAKMVAPYVTPTQYKNTSNPPPPPPPGNNYSGADIHDAIVNYLTAKNLPTDNNNIKEVMQGLDANRTQTLMGTYGKK